MTNPTPKPAAGIALPGFSATRLDGSSLAFDGSNGQWFLLVVYRGKHCGRCKKYLNKLESMQSQWRDAGFDILAVSADPIEKAKSDVEEFGWTFDIACGLSEAGFAEPGVFCIRPDNTVQIAAISNGPSARPDLDELLDGMEFTIEHKKPARGMA